MAYLYQISLLRVYSILSSLPFSAILLASLQKSKNIFINTIYRQPSGNRENFETYFGKLFEKIKTKITNLLGDFNLNLLHYETNCQVKSYCNTIFSHNFTQTINKPMRVTNHNETITNHVLTKSSDSKIDIGTLKLISQIFFQSFSPPNR